MRLPWDSKGRSGIDAPTPDALSRSQANVDSGKFTHREKPWAVIAKWDRCGMPQRAAASLPDSSSSPVPGEEGLALMVSVYHMPQKILPDFLPIYLLLSYFYLTFVPSLMGLRGASHPYPTFDFPYLSLLGPDGGPRTEKAGTASVTLPPEPESMSPLWFHAVGGSARHKHRCRRIMEPMHLTLSSIIQKK